MKGLGDGSQWVKCKFCRERHPESMLAQHVSGQHPKEYKRIHSKLTDVANPGRWLVVGQEEELERGWTAKEEELI